MALKIRLRQQGRKNHLTYRLVVTEGTNPRDGKYVESLGWYDPAKENEKNAAIEIERVNYWLGNGAQLTEKAEALIKHKAPEVVKEYKAKIIAKRLKASQKRREAKKKS
ncbi:MAG: 30S ribosomal protein S16 [Simkaniaceae bacterium]|nr:30S ribosomal protein S16 [Simkaniaceae bacterium]